MGGDLKNKGTLTNNSGKIISVSGNFQNYNGSAGQVNNAGTITVTVNYLNSNGTLNGTTANFITSSPGTIDVTGNYSNSTGYTYNSVAGSLIKVGGSLTNTTAARFATDTGTVDYKGGAVQTILANVKNDVTLGIPSYGALKATGGAFAKNLGGSVAVTGTVTVDNGATLGVNANKLTVTAASPFSIVSGSVDATPSSSEVDYAAASGGQAVLGTSYNKLTVSNGTGTRTAGAGVTVASVLTNNAATTLDFSTFSATLTGATITNPSDATLRAAGSVSITSGTSIGGTFEYYNSATSQSIGAANYANLAMSGGSGATGQKNFPNGDVKVSGTYTVGGADRNYTASTNSFYYNGTTAQTVAAGASEGYYNLTIEGGVAIGDTAVHKTVNAALTVNNALTVSANSSLDMSTFAISTLGSGSVAGKILYAANNGFAIAGGGYTEFYGTATGSVANGGYSSLLFTGSGVKTVAGATTTATYVLVSNNLTVSSSGDLAVTGDLDNDGSLTNDGTISVN